MKVSNLLKYIIFFGFSIIVLLPFFWTLYASFVESDLDLNTSILDFGKYGFSNFTYILERGDIFIWIKNSVVVVFFITIFNLIINTMAGYSLARCNFKGKHVSFMYIVGIMMIPTQVLVIPIFLVVSRLGLINTYVGLILPFVYNSFGVFLMRQFYLDFPGDLESAGYIDGLNHWGIFVRIALPLSKNALMTQAILICIWNWNSFILPSILVNTPDKFTLPLGIYQITNTQFITSVTKSMAGATVALIPTIIFYLIFQKKLINSDIGSGVKG